MTEFHALDLSGDRAALHRWDGRGWTPVATAPVGGAADDLGRVLADLLLPVAGMSVAVALPTDRIAVSDIMADAGTDPLLNARTDWVALPGGGWRRMTLPDSALTEIETFLTALGVRPGGCMAAAGDDLPPAWFGMSASPVCDGRATDRPMCLGPADPAPHSRIAAARLRAQAVAARDPAYQMPLPDVDPAPDNAGTTVAQRFGLSRLRLPAWRMRPRLLLLSALAVGVGIGALVWSSVHDRGPADRTPDVALLGAGPAPALTPLSTVLSPRDAAPDAAHRAAIPMLDGDASDIGPRDAPRPSQQASLSDMDTPPGMIAAATFYSPPYLLAVTAPSHELNLTIPGLDPVFRTDAMALPDARQSDSEPAARRTLNAPGPPEQVFVVDERGLIRPSPEGRVSPEGFTVVAGLPPAAVRPRPVRTIEDEELVQVMRRADLAADDPLRRLLPRLRPDGLAESRERDLLGGRTAGELAGFVPAPRPESVQEKAQPQAAPTAAVAQVVAVGPRPAPRNAAVIARVQTAVQTAVQPAPAPAPGPAVEPVDVARVVAPTTANVAERATTRVSINLSQINLLGTFGAGNSRRALVRLPSGRIVNLSVGDQVDGGRVQSIGDGQLGYVKSGRTVMLVMPRG